jgi:hypothetical protein
MFNPVPRSRLGLHSSCLPCLLQIAQNPVHSHGRHHLRSLTTTAALSKKKATRPDATIEPANPTRKAKRRSRSSKPRNDLTPSSAPTVTPASTRSNIPETSDFWKAPLSLGNYIDTQISTSAVKSSHEANEAAAVAIDGTQAGTDRGDGEGSKHTTEIENRVRSSKNAPKAPKISTGKGASLDGVPNGVVIRKLNSTVPPQAKTGTKNFIRVPVRISKVKSTSPSFSTTKSPAASRTSALVLQLQATAADHGKRMTKKALLELLNKDALTTAGKAMTLKKLRDSLLITKSHTDVGAVFEMASSRASGFESTIRNRETIKDTMLGRNPKQAAISKSIGPIRTKPGMKHYDIQKIDASKLKLTPHEKPQPPVPSLAYGLERVLFNPGVYHLRDPRSRVFNFDPYLQTIMPVADFDFSALKEYVTSSRDEALISSATQLKKKYTGSTSSMTSALAHFHYLLSQWRAVNISNLSKSFTETLTSFSGIQRAPAAIFLRWKNGVYAIDADKQYDTPNILSMLGKSMEKLLTLPTEDFEKYRKENSDQITEEERNELESFHYTTMGDFLMRSQLDAFDSRLPGTGMFDLKTRAVVSVRVDAENYENGVGYEIQGRHGEYHSYEREYYDMIRSAFLKYSLQVRMGRMDGIFVAFHNTERIFGFQYISLSEMDFAIHGTENTAVGDAEFKMSLELLNRVLDRATAKYPKQSLQIHFEARASTGSPFLYIFAEPVTEEQIDKIQNTGKEAIEKFERKVLGLHSLTSLEDLQENEAEEKEEDAIVGWKALQAEVEEQIANDELGDIETFNSPADDSIEKIVGYEELVSEDVDSNEVERQLDELLTAVNSDDIPETESGAEDCQVSDSAIKTAEDLLSSNHKESESEGLEGEAENVEPENDTVACLEESGNEMGIAKSDDGGSINSSKDSAREVDDAENNRSEGIETRPGKSNGSGSRKAEEKKKSTVDVLAMYMTIRNKVNGKYVERTENLSKEDKWIVEYALADIPSPRSRALYQSSQTRRKGALMSGQRESEDGFRQRYLEMMAEMVAKGRQFRAGQDELDLLGPLKVLKRSQ